MPELFGVPLHPALSHLPIAATVLAAGSLLIAALRRERPSPTWRTSAFGLLLVAILTIPLSVWSGRAWAIGLTWMRDGTWLPPGNAAAGVLRLHVLFAAGATLLLLVALPLAAAARHPKRSAMTVFLVTLLAAVLIAVSGHYGATMVYRPAKAAPAAQGKMP